LIAHRGIYDNKTIYENTLKAFAIAIEKNYIIEFDVHMLKDDIVIVYHDEDMGRLLNVDSKITDLTFGDIKYFAKFEIPTLKEVLEFVDGRVPIIIDIKGVTKKNKLEKEVLAFLNTYEGPVALQSFNEGTVRYLYKNAKEYPIGLLVNKIDFRRDNFFKKYDFLNAKINVYDDKRIRAMREKKMIIGYGVKDLITLNAKKDVYDNLICDNLLEIDKE
jgi:glycerophosphoryl diester phosphodiesterase